MVAATALAGRGAARTDRVRAAIVQQVGSYEVMRMQNVMLGHGMDHIVVVANPIAVAHVEHIGDIVAQLVIGSVVVDHGKELVYLLFVVVLGLGGQVFWKLSSKTFSWGYN